MAKVMVQLKKERMAQKGGGDRFKEVVTADETGKPMNPVFGSIYINQEYSRKGGVQREIIILEVILS